jgi:hypothetical protein
VGTDPEFLADPAELAVALGRAPDDPKVLFALRAATRRFRGQVGHPVTQVVDDEVVLDGNGRTSLLLPVWPVTAVTQVLLDGEELSEGTDFSWSGDGMLRRLCGRHWPDRLRCLLVTNTHGWPFTAGDWSTLPDDVVEAVLDQAQAGFNIRPGIQSMTTGAQSISFGAAAAVGATDTWTKAVARHKIRTSSDA